MTIAAVLIAPALLFGAADSAAPDIDRTALTWCQITPTDGAAVTLVTASGLHRSIADAARFVFSPAEVAAVQHAGELVPVDMTCTPLQPVDMTCTPLQPVGWAEIGPADTVVVPTPADTIDVPVVLAGPGDDPADVALGPPAEGVPVVGLIPAAEASAAPGQPVAPASSVPAAVDTVPTAPPPQVRASVVGRARAMAIAALRAVA